MKNKRINIKEEKFRIVLENWSRYRSEEISPQRDCNNDNLLVADLFGLTANHGVQVAFDGGKLPNITDSIAQLIFV